MVVIFLLRSPAEQEVPLVVCRKDSSDSQLDSDVVTECDTVSVISIPSSGISTDNNDPISKQKDEDLELIEMRQKNTKLDEENEMLRRMCQAIVLNSLVWYVTSRDISLWR